MTQTVLAAPQVFNVAADVRRVPYVGARGQLTGTSNTTVYTAPTLVDHPNDPSGTNIGVVLLTSVLLVNTDTTARTVTGHLVESGGSVAANRMVIPTLTLAANQAVEVPFGNGRGIALASGEFLNLIAGTANTITYRVSVELLPQ